MSIFGHTSFSMHRVATIIVSQEKTLPMGTKMVTIEAEDSAGNLMEITFFGDNNEAPKMVIGENT